MSFKSLIGKFLSSKEEAISWEEKRQDSRVDLITERELEVHLLNPETGDAGSTLIARVKNVSMRGCSLFFVGRADRDKVTVGKNFTASLTVDGFSIPLNVKVVRVIASMEVGVQFKPPFPRELEKLHRFLEPHCLGLSLREIDPAILQKEMKKGMRWFQGVNETHLFSWNDEGSHEILQQQLVFLDHVVEWKDGAPLRTGQIRQDMGGLEDGVDWVKSELLEFDLNPSASVLGQAQSILESSQVAVDVKNKFLEKLKEKHT